MVILDEKSIFENVAAGAFGRRAHTVAKEEVEDGFRAALIHGVICRMGVKPHLVVVLVVLGLLVGRSSGWLLPELG